MTIHLEVTCARTWRWYKRGEGSFQKYNMGGGRVILNHDIRGRVIFLENGTKPLLLIKSFHP
jgi:hypothetical protein